MRIHLAVCALVLLFVGTAAAQGRPDFSGTWVLVTPNRVVSAAQTLVVRQTFTRESVQGFPIDPPLITLAVERHSAGSVHSEFYTIGEMGGTVSGIAGSQPSAKTEFSTRWDGDRLVIENSESRQLENASSWSRHMEVWSLNAQGALSVVVTERTAANEPIATNLLYRRQP